MIETLLYVACGDYPFGEQVFAGSTVTVEDLQHFPNKQLLTFKKNEMKRVKSVLMNNSTIHLTAIFEQQLCLHYTYEWVAVSLKSFIQNQLTKQNYMEIKELSAKLLFSKLIAQINILISQLIKLGIQTELAYRLLGVHSNTLRIFVDKRCRVGKKSNVFLKEYYRTQKYQLIKQIQEDIIVCINKAKVLPNFIIRNNRLVFENKGSYFTRNTRPSAIADLNSESLMMTNISSSKDIEQTPDLEDSFLFCNNINNLNKERKFSQSKIECYTHSKKQPSKLRNSESTPLKNMTKKLETFNQQQQSPQQKHEYSDNFKEYIRSKSIRIKLEKSQRGKDRKESYKMIVTTCHQYETDNIHLSDVFKQAQMFDFIDKARPKQRKARNSLDESRFKLTKAKEKAESYLKNFISNKKTRLTDL